MTKESQMSGEQMKALADRIDATRRGWIPISGHIVNVTFALDEADAISAALRLAAQSAAPVGETWMDGAPDKPWSLEWFIAETTYGDRVVLVALPDEWTYDFKTADETYIKRDKIKRWMQFPDSQFVAAPPPSTPQVIDPIGLIHECADIADKYDDCGGSFIAEKIRELVFSRAKPGDS